MMHSILYLCGTITLSLLIACDETKPPTAEGTPSTTAEAEDFCAELCTRSSTCSLELARAEAEPADQETITAIEHDLPVQRATCREACQLDGDDERTEFQRERMRVCLGKADCAELDRCLSAL